MTERVGPKIVPVARGENTPWQPLSHWLTIPLSDNRKGDQ
jgi:hypothetical protein